MRGMFVEIGVAAAFALALASFLRVDPAEPPVAALSTADAIAALRVVTPPAVDVAAAAPAPVVELPPETEMAELPDLGFPYPAARIERLS